MGRLIDETLEYLKDFDSYSPYQEAITKVSDYMEQMQANYEARLKADMEAMFTEIQLEIEESENCGKAFHLGLQMASNIIQQKINSLKEVQE